MDGGRGGVGRRGKRGAGAVVGVEVEVEEEGRVAERVEEERVMPRAEGRVVLVVGDWRARRWEEDRVGERGEMTGLREEEGAPGVRVAANSLWTVSQSSE